MTYPTQNTQIVQQAVLNLTDHYKGKPVITGLINSWTGEIQILENVFWDIINKFLLVNNPTGDQLNQLGKLVGAQRGSLSDAQYLQAIIIQIRVNRSQGLAEDIIQIATLLNPSPLPVYTEFYPAAWGVFMSDIQAPQAIAKLLYAAKSVGTKGSLYYTNWPSDDPPVITFGSSVGPVPSERAFADHVSGDFPNVFCSVEVV